MPHPTSQLLIFSCLHCHERNLYYVSARRRKHSGEYSFTVLAVKPGQDPGPEKGLRHEKRLRRAQAPLIQGSQTPPPEALATSI